jgi:hypothetical protein
VVLLLVVVVMAALSVIAVGAFAQRIAARGHAQTAADAAALAAVVGGRAAAARLASLNGARCVRSSEMAATSLWSSTSTESVPPVQPRPIVSGGEIWVVLCPVGCHLHFEGGQRWCAQASKRTGSRRWRWRGQASNPKSTVQRESNGNGNSAVRRGPVDPRTEDTSPPQGISRSEDDLASAGRIDEARDIVRRPTLTAMTLPLAPAPFAIPPEGRRAGRRHHRGGRAGAHS